jgi:hypothetical protein
MFFVVDRRLEGGALIPVKGVQFGGYSKLVFRMVQIEAKVEICCVWLQFNKEAHWVS